MQDSGRLSTLTSDLTFQDRSAAFIAASLTKSALAGGLYDEDLVAQFFAHRRIDPGVVRLVKAAIPAIDTTSGLAPLRPLQTAFLAAVDRVAVLGRLGAVKVDGDTIALQVGNATAAWVGEQGSKPISTMSFNTSGLRTLKIVSNVVVSRALADLSAPNALPIIQRALTSVSAAALDTALLDPTSTAIAGVRPASVTAGVTPTTPAGDFANNVGQVLGAISGGAPTRPVLVVSLQTALRLQGLRDLEAAGARVLISPAAANRLIAIDADGVAYVDPGEVELTIGSPDLQMNDAPDSPPTASTVMTSTWQRNLRAVRCERWANWTKRPDAVAVLTLT